MGRHAYMIMAHGDFDQLVLLLQTLDHEDNDVFVHIDKKQKNWSRIPLEKSLKKASLFFVNPIRVNWGGDSQIKAELRLLEEATVEAHQYYHLLSGVDFPLKDQESIHRFFYEHNGQNFIAFEKDSQQNHDKSFMYKIDYFYPFQNLINRNGGIVSRALRRLQTILVQIQKSLGWQRTKNSGISFIKGSNWFSITHEVAEYVMKNYPVYKKHFRHTFCADEIFLQTIVARSPYLTTVVDDNLRFVDWERGAPYTFLNDDYELLMSSGKLFARKFDMKTDKTVLLRIKANIEA